MIVHPRIGQWVRIRYGKKYTVKPFLHDRIGKIVYRARGPGPRNHGVLLDGRVYVVPCGHLQKVPDA